MRLPPSVRCWFVLASLALRAPPVLAHAGLPETSNITVRRGHPEDLFAGATFGAVVSRDSGKTWRWICPEAMLYGGWSPTSFVWQARGELLAATGASLIRSRDGGCSWETHPFFSSRNLWPSGLEAPASTPSRLWVTTARASAPNGLFRSDDGGESFTAVDSLRSTTHVYTAVKVAPSNTRRLYVSGDTPDGPSLFRSDDEGSTWTVLPHPFPEYSGTSRPYDLRVLRVAENDPDHLWARVTAQRWTYLLESRDGGRTFQSILHPPQQNEEGIDEELVGIEVSADGRTVWAATPTRFFRIREGGPTTLLSRPEGNACAERQGDTLLVCGSTWVHDWALARTRDGDTYEPLFSLPDILPPACPASTPTQNICRPRWPQFAPAIGADATLPPEETPGGDAGTPEPPPKKSGCSSAQGLVPAACLLTLLPFLRSRRRDPEPPRS